MFLAMQAGVMLYSGVSIVALTWGIDHVERLRGLRNYVSGYNPLDVTTASDDFVRLYLILPLALIAPSTLLMGISFPLLQKAVQNSQAWLGRHVGWLQASNIFGSTLGAILVGALFLQILGTSWTLRLLVTSAAVFLILAIRHIVRTASHRRIAYAVAGCTMGILVLAMPGSVELWATFHGSENEHIIATEGASGLSIMKNVNAEFSDTTWVYANGLGQSWIPFHHVNIIHSRLGILPAMIHPQPKDIAVIGLGSGDTLFSVGGRHETEEITCIEIVEPQLEGLRRLQEKRPYGGLESLLTDVRINYVFADGRIHIGSNSKKYDIIEADALRATSAFAGNLYSYEYFLLLQSRLKPGGLAVTWAPTRRVLETFLKVFPHVMNFDSVVIGSDEPILFDPQVITSRLNHPFTRQYYEKAGLDAAAAISPFYGRTDLRLDHRAFKLTDLNMDLLPKDEYGR
jgi:spermidine synthase